MGSGGKLSTRATVEKYDEMVHFYLESWIGMEEKPGREKKPRSQFFIFSDKLPSFLA